MNKQIPNYLRLVTDTSMQPAKTDNEDLAALSRLCRAFSEATQWRLEYADGAAPRELTNLMWSAPVNPGVGASPGHVRLLLPEGSTSRPRVPREQAELLADAIGQMWGELLTTRHSLWQREAELATGVPVIVREDDERAPSLGQRLESVLRGGAEAIGCQAAALYLLDSATTELKLRASWGLPRKRLTEPARPLPPALADLEALLGHAVVLVEPSLFDYWKVPEPGYRSCVCVPISTPSMPLGTLWAYCDRVREFTDAETNMLEVVAGRLAADLERELLVDEAVTARDQSHQIAAAQRLQLEQQPRVAPLVEGWRVAARTMHSGPLGGTFYDWFALDDGSLSLVAGDVCQRGIEGAMTASLLRGAVRASGTRRAAAHELLEQAGSVLWTGSAGNSTAGMLHAVVEQHGEAIEFCAAGPMRVVSIRGGEFATLEAASTPLGTDEQVALGTRHLPAAPGELMLVYGTTFAHDADEDTLAALDQRLAIALEPRRTQTAEELIDVAAEILQNYFTTEAADRVVVLCQRRPQ
ncbi:MAG: GAF domain-containing protein [Planctomycetota bacterium]|nr:MAG: GAF domain-containing protein [Planctomycetota bacterium]